MNLCIIKIHKWKLIKDTGKHRYYECLKCRKRKVNTMFRGWLSTYR